MKTQHYANSCKPPPGVYRHQFINLKHGTKLASNLFQKLLVIEFSRKVRNTHPHCQFLDLLFQIVETKASISEPANNDLPPTMALKKEHANNPFHQQNRPGRNPYSNLAPHDTAPASMLGRTSNTVIRNSIIPTKINQVPNSLRG